MLGDGAALHRDLNDLAEWADGDLMKFNKSKCEVWQSNPMQLGLHVTPCSLAGWRATLWKSWGGHGETSRSRDVTVPFYSALLRMIRSTVSDFDSTPPHKKSIDKLKSSGRLQDDQGLEHMLYEERLREQGLFSLSSTS